MQINSKLNSKLYDYLYKLFAVIGYIVLHKILMLFVGVKHTQNQNGILQPLLSAYSDELYNNKDIVSLPVQFTVTTVISWHLNHNNLIPFVIDDYFEI